MSKSTKWIAAQPAVKAPRVRPVKALAPNVIRSSGRIGLDSPIPTHRAITIDERYGPDGYPSATVGTWTFGRPAKALPARRDHQESLAWCQSCLAAASHSSRIDHSAFCATHGHLTGPARTQERMSATALHRPAGCTLPAPIDGPSALARSARTLAAVRNGAGTGRAIRSEQTPVLTATGKWRTRVTAGTPDRGRVTVAHLSVHGHYALLMGIPLPRISPTGTRHVTGRSYWAWEVPYVAIDDGTLIRSALLRAAQAVRAGVANGRYDSVLADDLTREASSFPIGTLELFGANGRRRYIASGPGTAGLFTHRPIGANPIDDIIADTVWVGSEGEGSYLLSEVGLTRDGQPKSVRWMANCPSDDVNPETAHYGYLTRSAAATDYAEREIRSLTRMGTRLAAAPRRRPVPTIHYGIGRAVTANGQPKATRAAIAVNRKRRSRAEIIAAVPLKVREVPALIG